VVSLSTAALFAGAATIPRASSYATTASRAGDCLFALAITVDWSNATPVQPDTDDSFSSSRDDVPPACPFNTVSNFPSAGISRHVHNVGQRVYSSSSSIYRFLNTCTSDP